MSDEAWWRRGLEWVKKQYEIPEIPVREIHSEQSLEDTNFELVPGQLSVGVYRHLFPTGHGSIPCWSYVTTGLQRHGQREIVFTLQRGIEDTVIPKEPLRLFETIDQLAESGCLVDAGGVSQFGDRKFLGRHLAYIEARKPPGVAVPHSAICAILVTDDEVAAIQEFGITRVMARLGQAARYYPCPPWSDPSRPGISFAQIRQRTVLAQVLPLSVPGCRVYQADGKVVLLLAEGSGDILRIQLAELADDVGFAFLTELDPDSDGCFVWEPGESEPAAIIQEGSAGKRLCGCFVTFAVGQAEDGALGLEDGFGVFLTPQSWRAIQEAIGNEERIEVPATSGSMGFAVEWDSEIFHDPVDGASYVAPGGWREYRPQVPCDGQPTRKKVAIDHVRLLNSEDEIAARTTAEDLVEFSKGVERQVETFLDSIETPFELVVQFKCKRSGHEVQMAHQGQANHELLRELHKALTATQKLRVKESDVSFQIRFKVLA